MKKKIKITITQRESTFSVFSDVLFANSARLLLLESKFFERSVVVCLVRCQSLFVDTQAHTCSHTVQHQHQIINSTCRCNVRAIVWVHFAPHTHSYSDQQHKANCLHWHIEHTLTLTFTSGFKSYHLVTADIFRLNLDDVCRRFKDAHHFWMQNLSSTFWEQWISFKCQIAKK